MKKYLFTLIILFTLNSCNESNKKENNIEVNKKDSLTKDSMVIKNKTVYNLNGKYFDGILKCGDYVYIDKFFRMIDNGCVYNQSINPKNEIGWCDVILSLKNDDHKLFNSLSDDEIINQENTVNQMTSDALKKKFIPMIFVIEKKYLNENKNSEIKFYPKIPYVNKLFKYLEEVDEWIVIDSIKVNKEIDNIKWIESHLD